MALNEDVFYEMTKDFLTKGQTLDERPETIARVLAELKEVAPEVGRVLEQYITSLESKER